MKQHLQTRMRDGGIPRERIQFIGAVPRMSLPDLYRSAAVCVVPSLYENLPYTCLEAMACGCATIGSNVGGIPEIITDGVDGRLVPPADADGLAVRSAICCWTPADGNAWPHGDRRDPRAVQSRGCYPADEPAVQASRGRRRGNQSRILEHG